MRVDPSPAPGPVPRAAARPDPQATPRELRSDGSLHAIMEAYRRALGVPRDPPTPTPSSLVEDSFGRQMQAARESMGIVDRAPTPDALERALARAVGRLSAWWRARATGRRRPAQAPQVAAADATRANVAPKSGPPCGATARPLPPVPPAADDGAPSPPGLPARRSTARRP